MTEETFKRATELKIKMDEIENTIAILQSAGEIINSDEKKKKDYLHAVAITIFKGVSINFRDLSNSKLLTSHVWNAVETIKNGYKAELNYLRQEFSEL